MKNNNNWLLIILLFVFLGAGVILGLNWEASSKKAWVKIEPAFDFAEIFSDQDNSSNIIDRINIKMTPDQFADLKSAREEKFSVANPTASFFYNNNQYEVSKVKTRGSSSHQFDKKSLSIELKEPIAVGRKADENNKYEMKNFKLISLVYDNHYFENRLGYDLITRIGANQLFYKYVAVEINDELIGIYLLIEDPATKIVELNGEKCLLERGWYGKFVLEAAAAGSEKNCEQQKLDLENFYTQIPSLQGKELSDYLSQKIDMQTYYRKMAVDYFLQNGDYTDELILYGDSEQGAYKVMGWDYDDIFSDVGPHEISSPGGTGGLYGLRRYESRAEVIADVGDVLMMSIEDDLDYTIARDPYLYDQFLAELKVIAKTVLTDEYLSEIQIKITSSENE